MPENRPAAFSQTGCTQRKIYHITACKTVHEKRDNRGETTRKKEGGIAVLKRILIYVLGIIVLALGITLNTKTNLGVSPVISAAYCASVLTGIGFGAATFIEYMILIGLQAAILRRNFKP